MSELSDSETAISESTWLVRVADTSTLQNALAAPSEPTASRSSTATCWAPRFRLMRSIHWRRLKEQPLARASGVSISTQVAKLLSISRQTVNKRRQSYALLAVPIGTGDYRYPKCQFTASGVIPGFERVLRTFLVSRPRGRAGATTPDLLNRP